MQQVVTAQLAAILGDDTLAAYQARYLKQHSGTSLLHLAAAAQAGVLLDPSQAAASAQLILDGASHLHADALAIVAIVVCTFADLASTSVHIYSFAFKELIPSQWIDCIGALEMV